MLGACATKTDNKAGASTGGAPSGAASTSVAPVEGKAGADNPNAYDFVIVHFLQ